VSCFLVIETRGPTTVTLPRWRPWAYYTIGTLGVVALSMVARYTTGWLGLALGLVGAAWLILCSLYAWKRTDEAAQEAHKFAWFWGGGFGALLGLALLVIVMGAAAPHRPEGTAAGRIRIDFQISGKGIEALPSRDPGSRETRPLAANERIVTNESLMSLTFAGLMLGAFMVIMAQCIGYLLTWMGWWVSKR